MSDSSPIICKPTKWFIWRAVAMLVMFSVFAGLFVKDGIWGYKEENLHWYLKKSFDQAGAEFQRLQEEKGDAFSEAVWADFAKEQKVKFSDEAEQVLPEGTEVVQSWPQELIDGFALMDEKGGQNGAQKIWEDYTKAKSWDAEVAEKAHTPWKIKEQFVAASVAGALIAITLFFLIRTLRRNITADDQALHTQDGRTIAYTDMVKIDKRKWDTKGLAIVHYKDGEEEKTAKIDGMVYGQFKEEDGAPAEKLFARVMENFKGEVIEYVEEDEEDEEDESEE
ncbi:MAG: hypothetical protein ACPG32_01555 [Akkermansiaceae bacterium]